MILQLEVYGDQKGTLQTTARRLGQFLGAGRIFREKLMLKKEKEMVLDKELLDENRIEREKIEEGRIVKDSNKEDIDINI